MISDNAAHDAKCPHRKNQLTFASLSPLPCEMVSHHNAVERLAMNQLTHATIINLQRITAALLGTHTLKSKSDD